MKMLTRFQYDLGSLSDALLEVLSEKTDRTEGDVALSGTVLSSQTKLDLFLTQRASDSRKNEPAEPAFTSSALGSTERSSQDPLQELNIARRCNVENPVCQNIPVQHLKDKLVITDDFTLVSGLKTNITVTRPRDDHLGQLLGLESNEGCVARLDAIVGQIHCHRLLALSRSNLWWLSPEFGRTTRDIPVETQFVLLELEPHGAYAVLVPLIDGGAFRTTIRPSCDPEDINALKLRVESGCKDITADRWTGVLYVAAGLDPFQLVERSVCMAAQLSGDAKPRVSKTIPDIVNKFGWCTWDAFYTDVLGQGVEQGVQTLKQGGAPPKFVVIDDGWQCAAVDGPAGGPHAQNTLHKTADLDCMHSVGHTSAAGDASTRLLSPRCGNSGAYPVQPLNLDVLHNNLPPDNTSSSVVSTTTSGTISRTTSAMANGMGCMVSTFSSSTARNTRTNQPAPFSEIQPLIPHPTSPCGDPKAPGCDSVKSWGDDTSLYSPFDSVTRAGSGMVIPAASMLGSANAEAALAGAASFKKVVSDLERRSFLVDGGKPPTGSLGEALAVVRDALAQGMSGMWDGALSRVLSACKALADGAPASSLRCRTTAFLLSGPLRSLLLRNYARTSHHSQRLTSIHANAKFTALPDLPLQLPPPSPRASCLPSDTFRDFVSGIKTRYGVQYVYSWHAAMGFWCGIEVNGGAMAKYKPQLVFPEPTEGTREVDPQLSWIQPVVAGVGVAQDVEALHGDMHSYLAGCGVDGVKVDAQSTLGMIGTALRGGPALSAQFHASLETSIQRHFPGNHAMNCMCHSSEDVYRMRDTCLARSSDDFVPDVPSSHTAHIVVNAFNSLYLGALVLPDWDMFHSRHEAAFLHACARAISGGPVYVSDKPGCHDFALLRTLVLPDGRVLRPLLPGRPTRDSTMTDVWKDGKSLLKVWNVNPCGGVVAVFNVQGSTWDRSMRRYHSHATHVPALTGTLRATDVEALRQVAADRVQKGEDVKFVMQRQADGAVYVVGPDEDVETRVERAGAEMWTIVPIMSHAGLSIAPLGISHLLNGGGAVRSCRLYHNTSTTDGTVDCMLRVMGQGMLAVYCTHRPSAVCARPTADSAEGAGTSIPAGARDVTFEYSPEECMLRFGMAWPGDERDTHVLITWEDEDRQG